MALKEQARRARSRSFKAFVLQAWEFVQAVDPLVWGWHMDALCDHVEAQARGRIWELLVNIPPGHAKSVIFSVLAPAWTWTWWPQCQFLCGSHSLKLAVRDSIRCRSVIESEWYQQEFCEPGGWQLAEDQNQKDNFANTKGGERVSVGIGGVGRRAHWIIVDDPNDLDQIHSEAHCESVKTWMGTTLSQRFVDASRPRFSVVQQRCGINDASQHFLKGKSVVHLRLSAENDPADPCVTYARPLDAPPDAPSVEFWREPRTEVDEPLFPARFPKRVLERFKQPDKLGLAGFACIQNQKPSAGENAGKLFPRASWRIVDQPPQEHDIDGRVRRWDLAATEGGGDYTASVKVLRIRLKARQHYDYGYIVVDATENQFGPRGVRKLVRAIAEADGEEVPIVIPQDPAQAGKDQAADYAIMLDGFNMTAKLETGDKVTKNGIASSQVVAQNVALLRAPWNERFMAVCEAFPTPGVEDDLVDALGGAIVALHVQPRTMAEELENAEPDEW